MAAPTTFQISGLLEKMTNIDKDFRYMAVNDLMAELSKSSIALDEDMEKRIVSSLLTLIQDKNAEVQNLTCRCLGPLVHKLKLPQLEMMIDALCVNLSSSNESLRDVSSIALKIVLNELPTTGIHQTVYNCVKRVVPKLLEALKTDSSAVKLEVLDVLGSLLMRYGRTVDLYFDQVETIIFAQLEKERPSLRKRALNALGYLTDVVPDEQFGKIMQRILTVFSKSNVDLGTLKTFVLASITTCRVSSVRITPFIPKIMPLLIQKCRTVDDDELRENCLQAFESFIFRCTNDMEDYVGEISSICTEYISYDPNYNYGNGDECEMEMDEETNDVSWKVRRASAKCIEALITYRHDALEENYDKFGSLLINRFKEREDNVKYDLLFAYSALLKLTKQLCPELAAFNSQNLHGTADFKPESFSASNFERILNEEMDKSNQQVFIKLKRQVPSLMRALQREIKTKNITTRLNCYNLMSHLIRAYPGILKEYLEIIATNIKSTLSENSSTDGNIKIEALRFISLILTTHAYEDLNNFVDTIVPLLVKSIEDVFYKTSAEALLTTQLILYVLNCQKEKLNKNNVQQHVLSLHQAIVIKLRVNDIDQEVKEKTISTTGLLLSLFTYDLTPEINQACLSALFERLRNEMTRLVTVRSINTIVDSNAKIELQPFLPDLLTLCSEFLRKNQRSLRLSTLILLESLVKRRFNQNGLQGPGLIKVVKEIPALISEIDIQLSQIAVTFITNIVNSYPDQILSDSLNNLFKSIISLVQSSLLQGSTLIASLGLIAALIRSPLPNKPSFDEIISKLTEPVHSASAQLLHRQAYSSIAKAVATVTQATSDNKKAAKLVTTLRNYLKNQSSDSVRLYAILALGELGHSCSETIDAAKNEIRTEQLIIESFGSPLEEIKSAASYALGNLATGNLTKFLPFLLMEISKEERRQYLFLHALKEVIDEQTGATCSLEKADVVFTNGVAEIWELLIKYCGSNEESIRNVVAECIGRLCTVNPGHFVGELQQVNSSSANVRATVVTALRFLIAEQPRTSVDEHLRPVLGRFFAAIRDNDLNVRRVAIVTLNSAVHNKPKLIKEYLPSLLQALYEETKVKQELVREVEMGPFKHVVDDGLDLRKAAFECMYTLADQCLDRVNLAEYLSFVENGLKDSHDIRLLAYLMLTRLPQLLSRPKQNAVKQESDKHEELKRSAVRTVLALKRVPNSDRSQKLTDLWDIINTNNELTAMKEMQAREQTAWTAVNGFGHLSPHNVNEAMEIE
uniref:TATA-binding protein interacting (TIP20) domain-containing protein n=1 Tax=Meloidogyne floridensis TaxID=298350 RepID=A0A915PB19_9BILA